MSEVSRVHSSPEKFSGRRDEPKNNKALSPEYIAGFVDGEGCFCVSVSKHKTLKRRLEVRPQFEIELRDDDEMILKMIGKAIGCGNIYHLNYDKYGWRPHVKYKVTAIDDLFKIVVPFFRKYPLRAKKAKTFSIWSRVVEMVYKKEHLKYGGFERIIKLRDKIREENKKH